LFLDMQMIIHPEDEIMSLSDVGNQMHHSMNYVFVVSLLPTILTSVSWLCLHFLHTKSWHYALELRFRR
jgi:hypothetical protein